MHHNFNLLSDIILLSLQLTNTIYVFDNRCETRPYRPFYSQLFVTVKHLCSQKKEAVIYEFLSYSDGNYVSQNAFIMGARANVEQ